MAKHAGATEVTASGTILESGKLFDAQGSARSYRLPRAAHLAALTCRDLPEEKLSFSSSLYSGNSEDRTHTHLQRVPRATSHEFLTLDELCCALSTRSCVPWSSTRASIRAWATSPAASRKVPSYVRLSRISMRLQLSSVQRCPTVWHVQQARQCACWKSKGLGYGGYLRMRISTTGQRLS